MDFPRGDPGARTHQPGNQSDLIALFLVAIIRCQERRVIGWRKCL